MQKRILTATAAAVFLWAVSPAALAGNEQTLTEKDKRVFANATEVLDSLTNAPDKAIPREMLERAECLMVFPNVVKGAFIVGGRYGRGVAVCRTATGLSAPAYFSVGGASVGWQWGGESTDLVLLVMDKDGMKHLLEDKFTLGAKASAAAGPVGRSAEASTDAKLQAQILSWSRTEGLFAGASLEGAVIQQSEDANRRMYGEHITATEILGSTKSAPSVAGSFLDLAARVTHRVERKAEARER